MIQAPRRTMLAILCMELGLSGSAFAQNGGTYCVGPSYIAYELADSESRDDAGHVSPARHSLHVIPLDTIGDIGDAREVPLPIFVVHGMQCQPTQVGILGWDSLYIVPLVTAVLGPIARHVAPWTGQGPSRVPLPEFRDSTLWHGWIPDVVDTVVLPLTPGQTTWILTIDAREGDAIMCEYRVRTSLVRFGTSNLVSPFRILYDEVLTGECGE